MKKNDIPKPNLTDSEARNLHRWIKIFVIMTVLSSLFGILHNLHTQYDPALLVRPGHLDHVHIGGRDFAVPDEYIRGPRPTEANAKQLYLWMMLPDYTPYRGFDSEEKLSTVPVAERHVMVLIYDANSTGNLQTRYQMTRNGPNSIYDPKDVADTYGLHHTLVYKSNARSPAPWINADLYFQTASDGTTTRFISCMPDTDEPHSYPQCVNHDFQDGQLLYQISYGKLNLPNWLNIETHIHELVESFSCVPANNSKPLSKGDKICPR